MVLGRYDLLRDLPHRQALRAMGTGTGTGTGRVGMHTASMTMPVTMTTATAIATPAPALALAPVADLSETLDRLVRCTLLQYDHGHYSPSLVKVVMGLARAAGEYGSVCDLSSGLFSRALARLKPDADTDTATFSPHTRESDSEGARHVQGVMRVLVEATGAAAGGASASAPVPKVWCSRVAIIFQPTLKCLVIAPISNTLLTTSIRHGNL